MKYEKFKDLYTQFLISEKNLSRNTVNNYLVDLDQFFHNEDIKVSDLNAKIKSYITNLRKKNLKITDTDKISVNPVYLASLAENLYLIDSYIYYVNLSEKFYSINEFDLYFLNNYIIDNEYLKNELIKLAFRAHLINL